MISLVVAMDKDHLIGNQNQLPWYLPSDLKYFKEVTMNKIVIMGRKTFESIGKPLPNRINIVISRTANYNQNNVFVYQSVDDVINEYNLYSDSEQEVFVIGGSEIFKQFLPIADRLYITEIDNEFKGDTYFPEVSQSEWYLNKSIDGIVDEKNPYKHTFKIYEKK